MITGLPDKASFRYGIQELPISFTGLRHFKGWYGTGLVKFWYRIWESKDFSTGLLRHTAICTKL